MSKDEFPKPKLRYECTITGDVAPFVWKVVKPKSAANKNTSEVSKQGSADTYEDALFQATEAAYEWEHERRHQMTVRYECVLEVDEEITVKGTGLLDDLELTDERN